MNDTLFVRDSRFVRELDLTDFNPYDYSKVEVSCKNCHYNPELDSRFREFHEVTGITGLNPYELDSLSIIDELVQSKIYNYDSILNPDILAKYIELDYMHKALDGKEDWEVRSILTALKIPFNDDNLRYEYNKHLRTNDILFPNKNYRSPLYLHPTEYDLKYLQYLADKYQNEIDKNYILEMMCMLKYPNLKLGYNFGFDLSKSLFKKLYGKSSIIDTLLCLINSFINALMRVLSKLLAKLGIDLPNLRLNGEGLLEPVIDIVDDIFDLFSVSLHCLGNYKLDKPNLNFECFKDAIDALTLLKQLIFNNMFSSLLPSLITLQLPNINELFNDLYKGVAGVGSLSELKNLLNDKVKGLGDVVNDFQEAYKGSSPSESRGKNNITNTDNVLAITGIMNVNSNQAMGLSTNSTMGLESGSGMSLKGSIINLNGSPNFSKPNPNSAFPSSNKL